MSDESNLLRDALFQRAMRANRSQSLFNMSDFEQKSKKANSQPCHLQKDFTLGGGGGVSLRMVIDGKKLDVEYFVTLSLLSPCWIYKSR